MDVLEEELFTRQPGHGRGRSQDGLGIHQVGACHLTNDLIDGAVGTESQGIQILVCGTCLGYFELTERLAVGQVSNMYDIAETMLSSGKVVNL